MRDTHFIKKTFVRQHDSSDCGVACLRSTLRYYGGDETPEHLRELSGTSIQGTTLLGLYEAANKSGFDAEGCEAELVDLIAHNEPTILHVLVEGDLEHYVLWYGCSAKSGKDEASGEKTENVHLVGDPAVGIIELGDHGLASIWQSKKCLTLKPNIRFERTEARQNGKKEWFLNLLRDDWGLLATAATLGLLMALLGMVMTIFSQKLIDEILPSKKLRQAFVWHWPCELYCLSGSALNL